MFILVKSKKKEKVFLSELSKWENSNQVIIPGGITLVTLALDGTFLLAFGDISLARVRCYGTPVHTRPAVHDKLAILFLLSSVSWRKYIVRTYYVRSTKLQLLLLYYIARQYTTTQLSSKLKAARP